jgi:hypothetical protein
MNEFEKELGPREVEALHDLAREKTPPTFLEERVVTALRQSQLIRSPLLVWRRRLKMTGLAVAASAVLITVGAVFGAWWKSAPRAVQNLPEFMFVLRNSPRELPTQSAKDQMQRVREYSLWARDMNGVLDGEELADDAKLLNVIDGRTVVSEMEADAKKTAIAGYFLIMAHDYQQAITIAETCPHLKYGGTVEIRQIERHEVSTTSP